MVGKKKKKKGSGVSACVCWEKVSNVHMYFRAPLIRNATQRNATQIFSLVGRKRASFLLRGERNQPSSEAGLSSM